MKNQWLMLLKNGDGYNFTRDFPFILAREAFVIAHNLLFNPSALVAIPMTLRMLPATLRAQGHQGEAARASSGAEAVA
jgi:hypothetical protein